MFEDIEYDHFPFIISSGNDFTYEIQSIKTEILPRIQSRYHNKLFSLKFFDLIFPNRRVNAIKSCELNDFVLLNLDNVHQNGSICICLLGEQFEQDSNFNSVATGTDYQEKLDASMRLASKSGYPWILEGNQQSDPSLLEILSLHAGLTSHLKYPLFYFRVSGGPICDIGGKSTNDNLDNIADRMEILKQKLIRKGLPIKFYGSASEFHLAVEEDLNRIFLNFPDRTDDRDIDQHCFENNHKKTFTSNKNIKQIFQKLDRIYTSFSNLTETSENSLSTIRIDELLKDFYRKEFSDRLSSTYKILSAKISSQSPTYNETRIFVLIGPRGSGKSTILINWLKSRKTDNNIIHAVHYCEASFPSSDLRLTLRSIIKQIRSFCGFTLEQDNYEMLSLDSELTALSQELLGAMLLAKKYGFRVLILIDGLDHLGDKCSFSPKKIKFIDWIPESIPDNVRIIMSCTVSDSSLRKLKEKRTDLYIIECLSDSAELQKSLIGLGISGLQAWTKRFGQIFPPETIQHVDNWSLIRIPLVQKILAQVYHTLGTTTNWNQFILNVSECQTLVELMRRVLRLEIQFLNWEIVVSAEKSMKKKYFTKKDEEHEESSIQGWVPDCLSLLALSPSGLNIEVILASLEMLGYVKDFQVVESDLWSLFHYTRNFLLHFHGNKFAISHSVCKEIIEHTFLAIASCSSVEARSHESRESMYIDKRCKMHILLAYNLWNLHSTTEYSLSECVYHLDRASDYQSLERIMFNPWVLLSMFEFDFELMSDWYGQLRNAHRFLYYWNLLEGEGYDLVSNIQNLLRQYYNFELVNDTIIPSGTDIDNKKASKHLSQLKKTQSEFSKKLTIELKSEKDERKWEALTNSQKSRFLLLVAQICTLVEYKTLARQIYNHMDRISFDNILICHVLWYDISLDSTFHYVSGNQEYVNLTLNRLEELTGSIIDEDTHNGTVLSDRVKYLRSLCLVLKYSIRATSSKRYSSRSEYLEIMSYSQDLKSIILTSITDEFEYNSMETREDPKFVQDRLLFLSDLIVMLETWTGPVHRHLAKLFVRLACLFKCGNSQSKLKAEACCRRALWIWNMLHNKKEEHYNNEANECIEILSKFLLQDPTHSSLIEAKTLIYNSFDNRMKFLGCYHPLTTQLVPIMKLVNSIESQFDSKVSSSKSPEEQRGLFMLSKNQSNLKLTPSIFDTSQKDHNLIISRNNMKPKRGLSSNLQFINRYFGNSDCFSEDIDWNDIANGRPGSKSSKTSTSRFTSDYSKRNSALSFHLNSTELRCHSTPVCDDRLTYTFLGHTSSLSSLIKPASTNERLFMSRNIKQVRFNNFRAPVRANVRSAEIARVIQKKLQDMSLSSNVPKRTVTANF